MLIGQFLCKSFNNQEVLKEVSISLAPGQITALIGPSGAGKTTLLKALSLVEPPDSGVVSMDGFEYKFGNNKIFEITSFWPKVTVVFQQFFLWPHLTIKQNIVLPLRKADTNSRRFQEIVETFSMKSFLNRFPNEVSIGEKQRAAIARAMVLEPRYVLLDEITSALDVEQIKIVLNMLRKFKAEGTGILLITHLISFARNAADQIVFLDKGEVVASGDPSILNLPTQTRLKQFLSLMEEAN